MLSGLALALSTQLILGDPVELSWRAPASCPKAAWGRARVEAFLGSPLESASNRGELSIGVELRESGDGYEATIEFAEDETTRSFADPDCEVLADAAAFVVASNIDPEMLGTEPERETEPELEPEPEPEPELELEPEPEPESEPRRRVGFAGSALAQMRPLLLSGPGPGSAVRFALLIARFRVEFEVFGASGARKIVQGGPSTLRVSVLGAAARGCFAALDRDAVELPVCVGLEAAGLAAHDIRDVLDPQPGWEPWLAVTLGAGATWRITPVVGLGAGLDVAVAARRPAFIVEGLGLAHRPAPVAITPWLALELRTR